MHGGKTMLLANALRAGAPADAVMAILQDLLRRLRIPQIHVKLHEQLLTTNERHDYDEEARQWERPVPIDMWITRRRGISHKLAIVQLAYRADVLPLSDRDWLLRELGEECPIDWEIQHAVSLGGLVVVDAPRVAFWDGLKIRLHWKDKPMMWRTLSQLAAKARINAPLTEADIYRREAASNSALANVIGRLKKKLPPTLSALIRPGIESRTHQLHLDPDRIRVFTTARRAAISRST
jgi:hypothetical protein